MINLLNLWQKEAPEWGSGEKHILIKPQNGLRSRELCLRKKPKKRKVNRICGNIWK